ncbi:MAG: cytidine deaminase [Solobacterium sp.]|jgi:cytidine deaminase|nr:cytidine deaminase [Solobacterium sp.]
MTEDIWEKLHLAAKKEYHPEEVSPFVYAHHVVAALESKDGTIYTGFCIESCSGVMNLCAERTAALRMYADSGQTEIKRLIAFRDAPPSGDSGMPCGACREFMMQLNGKNRNMVIMLDYESRKTITLGELVPHWWGEERIKAESEKSRQE